MSGHGAPGFTGLVVITVSCKMFCVEMFIRESLTREREIVEERAEKRMEIYKNLSNKMAGGPSQDAQAMVTVSCPSCPLVIGMTSAVILAKSLFLVF